MERPIYVWENGKGVAKNLELSEADIPADLPAKVRDEVRCHFEEGTGRQDCPPTPCSRRSHRRMRLPHDLSGNDLAQFLRRLDYSIARHTGSHLRSYYVKR